MKNKLITLGLGLLLSSPVSAGGIYRYHDEDAYKAYRAQEAYNNAKKQYKLMQKRATEYKRLSTYHRKATKYSRAYERQDSKTFDAEAQVWDSGVNVPALYRPGLDFKQTSIKLRRY
jgi:fructose-1,6-bisphosphatase/inositol monophosphatase family enzyme